jgi:hypothetical protein
MTHIFQIEAIDTLEHLSQDLPRDFRTIEETQGKRQGRPGAGRRHREDAAVRFLLNRLTED